MSLYTPAPRTPIQLVRETRQAIAEAEHLSNNIEHLRERRDHAQALLDELATIEHQAREALTRIHTVAKAPANHGADTGRHPIMQQAKLLLHHNLNHGPYAHETHRTRRDRLDELNKAANSHNTQRRETTHGAHNAR